MSLWTMCTGWHRGGSLARPNFDLPDSGPWRTSALGSVHVRHGFRQPYFYVPVVDLWGYQGSPLAPRIGKAKTICTSATASRSGALTGTQLRSTGASVSCSNRHAAAPPRAEAIQATEASKTYEIQATEASKTYEGDLAGGSRPDCGGHPLPVPVRRGCAHGNVVARHMAGAGCRVCCRRHSGRAGDRAHKPFLQRLAGALERPGREASSLRVGPT